MENRFEILYFRTCAENTYVDFHQHDLYELVYYPRGSGYITIDGERFRYTKNSFSCTSPNHPHDELHVEETDVLYIRFWCNEDVFLLKNGIYYDTPQRTVQNLLEEMKHEVLTRDVQYREKLNALLKILLVEMARMDKWNNYTGNDLKHIIKYIRDNYNQKFDLKQLAGQSGYSYHHFRHLFKINTGLSPHAYILQERLSNARYLLDHSGTSVTTIAQECGFYNTSQLSVLFKRAFGKSPRQYRYHFN